MKEKSSVSSNEGCEPKRPCLIARFFIKIRKLFGYIRKFGWRATYARIFQKRNEKKHIKNISLKISDARRHTESSRRFPRAVKFSITVPLYNTPLAFLRDMVESVRAQSYGNFELCLADGSDSEHGYVGEACREYSMLDGRIKYKRLSENLGISENTNAAIDMATGDFIALFDHDDILHPSALYEMMLKISDGADVVYTDEAVFESPDVKNITFTHYKPDYGRDNLLANNYICHFTAFSRELLGKAGRLRREYDGSQDHDFILRLTAAAKKIAHIPKILYFWRSHPASVAQDISAKNYAVDAGIAAVRTAIEAEGREAYVTSSTVSPTVYRIKYPYPERARVSVVISEVRKAEELMTMLASLLGDTKHEIFDITVILDKSNTPLINDLKSRNVPENLKLLECDAPTGAASLKLAVQASEGEYIAFIKGCMCEFSEGWLAELLMYASRSDVALAAGAVYYPDKSIRHAGYVVGRGEHGVAARLFHKSPKNTVGYMMRLWYSQNLSAVSDELCLIRRELFDSLGGFDADFGSALYDIDLSLRAREAGYNIVWNPYSSATLISSPEYELAPSSESAQRDFRTFREKHREWLSSPDPYYNVNFRYGSFDFTF